ncbi:MAG: hypothetical protein WCY05_06745 [Candidatus Omnitrophota bacterium]
MTKIEYQKIEHALKERLERVKTDKDYSRELLKKTGIYKEDGTLSENFDRV